MIREVSYPSAGGDTVTAWLVASEAPGAQAGLFWQHWGFGSRDSFRAEAYAAAAAASKRVGYPLIQPLLRWAPRPDGG